ncbi:hypothetical protein FJT64_020987 [Amphibalanus amphitrite]|uniref:Uncharacterized protein n=1 Tax=Amphibalanus amphitrite TaxID=1232801 RepID=A0A6A4WNU3_AMPAM|nr:hypothetical protein FJT64_020987 [Amphibalanus amphitrite]
MKQRFGASMGEAEMGTLEGLLNFVMARFAAQHPDRLPGALPPAVLRLLLTLMEALSAGGGCSLLLRGRRTPGLRTAVQLACFVTQQRLVDLRPHVADPTEAVPVLCRCVLSAMFGDGHQCLCSPATSGKLRPIGFGFGQRIRHLEKRGTLLTVAGDTIARRLHVVVSCSVEDGARDSHFPELCMQARWPSFFRATVLSLPDWPAADYAKVARRYIGSLDSRLAGTAVSELLVALHLAPGSQAQAHTNSLSLLYQLCEAFVPRGYCLAAGLSRVCRLISIDIVTEDHLDRLEQLLCDPSGDQLRPQLQEQCAPAVDLLDWLLQLTVGGRCYHQMASAAAQSSRLSEEYVRLQTALLGSRQQAGKLQQLYSAAAEQLQRASDLLQTARRRVRHAEQRRDWLARLEVELWRPDAAPDGSRSVGCRLSERLSRLAERAEGCDCPEVKLLLPSLPASLLVGLPEQLRGHLSGCPPWFSRHPLTTDADEFVRRSLLPTWYSDRPESAAGERGSRLSVLLLSVALRRPSVKLIVVSDPEAQLEHGLRHLDHHLPTVTQEELLQRVSQDRTTEEGTDKAATSADDGRLEDAWHSDQHHHSVLGSLLSGKAEDTGLDPSAKESQSFIELSEESQTAVLGKTTFVSLDDSANISSDSLFAFVAANDRRLVVRCPGDAAELVDRLLRACRGQQHLVTHLDLFPSSESVSALIGPLVVRLIRPQVHRDQRTYQDDLRYWRARRAAAQRRLLAQWPELLGLLEQLLRAGRTPLPSLEKTVRPAAGPTAAAVLAAAAPRLHRPQLERPTLRPSVVQLNDGETGGRSMTDVTLMAAPAEPTPRQEPGSELCDTAQLSAELKRRRRETRASLELARTWRDRLERLEPDGEPVPSTGQPAGARRRLASLRQCESSLLQMVAEVDSLDAGAANCRYQLALLVEQRAPLQPVVAFFSGLYTAVAALRLQTERLSLELFAGWLALSLRARAAAKLEDRKSADYFRLLGASDVLPRLLERLPDGWRYVYLVLAALLAAGWTDEARLRLLVHGPASSDGWHQRWLPACPSWATERQWLALGALSRQVPAARRLVAALKAGDDAGWQARLAAGPDVLDRGGLAAGDWALVWRALQPGVMPAVIGQLINCALGPAAPLALAELGVETSEANQALGQLSRCAPAVAYSGLSQRLVEKLITYVRQLLALLRRERRDEPLPLADETPPATVECPWARYLAQERCLARSQVCRVHDELVEVRRLLSARLAPTSRLEALVTCLAERSTPAQWVPAGGSAPGRLPLLLRHLLAVGRHVQQLVESTPRLWAELPAEPMTLRLGQLPRPAQCLPSLREAQHPAPARAVHVRLDMRHVHSEQRAQLEELAVGWRRRPRAEHVLLALCAVTEPDGGDGPLARHQESAAPLLSPPSRRSRAGSVVDPTMKKFVEQVRLSVG